MATIFYLKERQKGVKKARNFLTRKQTTSTRGMVPANYNYTLPKNFSHIHMAIFQKNLRRGRLTEIHSECA